MSVYLGNQIAEIYLGNQPVTQYNPYNYLYVGGYYTTYNSVTSVCFVSLDVNGGKLPNFNIGSGSRGSGPSGIGSNAVTQVWKSAVQSDNKVIVVGEFTSFNSVISRGIARLLPNGELDSTFNIGSGAFIEPGVDADVYALKVLSDDRIAVGGNFRTFNEVSASAFVILDKDGNIETTGSSFTAASVVDRRVNVIETTPDGKLLVGGHFTSPTNRFARLNTDGTLDGTYDHGAAFNGPVYSIKVTDSAVFVGGNFTTFKGTTTRTVAKLTTPTTLTLDTTFASNLGNGAVLAPSTTGIVRAIDVLPSGLVLIGGDFNTFNSFGSTLAFVWLSTDGTFNPNSASNRILFGGPDATNTPWIYDIKVLKDRTFLVGGRFNNVSFYDGSNPTTSITQNRFVRIRVNEAAQYAFSVVSGSWNVGTAFTPDLSGLANVSSINTNI
jgi:hypothetical protein